MMPIYLGRISADRKALGAGPEEVVDHDPQGFPGSSLPGFEERIERGQTYTFDIGSHRVRRSEEGEKEA